jgi:hypothetical protein
VNLRRLRNRSERKRSAIGRHWTRHFGRRHLLYAQVAFRWSESNEGRSGGGGCLKEEEEVARRCREKFCRRVEELNPG